MHFMYRKANGSVAKATYLYSNIFPDRQQSTSKLFSKSNCYLSETDSCKPLLINNKRPKSVYTL